ncbi:hypothetical protein ACOMHN_066766 [Nucella lapillus]
MRDLMILDRLPRDDLDYAQKVYRQLGLDNGPPPKPQNTPRKDALHAPRGDSNHSFPLKSTGTAAFKSLQSTPRRSRNAPSRQNTSDASPRLKPTPPPSRKSKTRQGRKRDASPREDGEAHVTNTMTAAQFMARTWLLKSQTTLSDAGGGRVEPDAARAATHQPERHGPEAHAGGLQLLCQRRRPSLQEALHHGRHALR